MVASEREREEEEEEEDEDLFIFKDNIDGGERGIYEEFFTTGALGRRPRTDSASPYYG